MPRQEQKKHQRPDGIADRELTDEITELTIDVSKAMKDLAQAIRDTAIKNMNCQCCDRCNRPCGPNSLCQLHPSCSDGTHPCGC